MRNVLLKALKSIASIDDWSGRWVHYSKTPHLTINPKQFHQDPAGYYFFPEEFETETTMWKNMSYKFIVELPSDVKVLDLDTVTRDEMIHVVKHCLAYVGADLSPDREERLNTAPNHQYQDIGWEMIRMSKMMSHPAKWNKALRELGYDAVFDDTKSIHSSEVQLLILHPRKLKIVDMVRLGGTQFKDLEKVTNEVAEMFKHYGEVEIEEPKARKSMWSRDKELSSIVRITKDKREVSLELTVNKDRNEISIHLSYARPSLSYGTGFRYDYRKNEYKDLDRFKEVMDKIFNGPHEYEVGKE